ncbi:hypothetical protein K1X22_21820 [Mycolicibacterium farcinogenes]|uniref:hypothetical protein n=1 Tax=Mycolicibacterium farcinogenes TaxID=1802 RepID=UPI001C8E9839|nr:hypothetical protein [Mycolicibacterium farcinogenes]QZH58868.1 hypothetical protein K1X22_21820 [Mycolicibacterium farcinogenes]
MDPYVWGDAEVTHTDWTGTAALDEKLTGPTDIYDYTGVDRDEWTIVGLDFGGGETGMHTPSVIAVRESELDGRHITDLSAVNAAEIQIHGLDPFELLKKMTHYLDMRFRSRAIKNATVTITEQLDVSPQE